MIDEYERERDMRNYAGARHDSYGPRKERAQAMRPLRVTSEALERVRAGKQWQVRVPAIPFASAELASNAGPGDDGQWSPMETAPGVWTLEHEPTGTRQWGNRGDTAHCPAGRPGDVATLREDRGPATLEASILSVRVGRVKDVVELDLHLMGVESADEVAAEWNAIWRRRGAPGYDRNPWCWIVTVDVGSAANCHPHDDPSPRDEKITPTPDHQ